jgi:hypothetical protein
MKMFVYYILKLSTYLKIILLISLNPEHFIEISIIAIGQMKPELH